MKKTILVFFFIMINIIIACTKVECPTELPYFVVKGLRADNQERIGEEGNWTAEVPNNLFDTISQKVHFVSIYASEDYVASQSVNYGGELIARNDCEVIHGTAGSKYGLKNIHIITLNDFNATYQANDTITDIVVFDLYNYQSKSFDDYLSKEAILLETASSIPHNTFAFKVTESIANEYQEVHYKIVLEFTNDAVFEATTHAMTLKK